MSQTTKNGHARKGKATISERRLELRDMTWAHVKRALQQHLYKCGHGEASHLARDLGVHPSQVHRYTCPVCEHDQEPPYSVGIAIVIWLIQRQSVIPALDKQT